MDVVVVGAGFGGLYALHRLRSLGFTVQVIEAGADVGGTWYWNRYPGARCDVESIDYSYSFDPGLEQEWDWTERYATQPEILAYLNHVADRFDLRRDIRFDTRVDTAHFDEAAGRWSLRTDDGQTISAQWCVMATGCLSTPNAPDYPGIDDYAGCTYHTARWPHEGVDFTGQRVAVIGTGSSAIQAVPLIAEQAAELVVFQRTANFSVPAHNHPLDPEYQRDIKARYPQLRQENRASFTGIHILPNDKAAAACTDEERRRALEDRWAYGGVGLLLAFPDTMFDRSANEIVADFVRSQIRSTVADPAVADALSPRGYSIGSKRLCVDTGYYATFNRDNVRLVDVRATPIEEFTDAGIRTAAEAFTFDSIVFATGFDAISGALLAIDIRGRAGRTLRDAWADGPQAYLGVAAAGFPNLFMVTGPGSPSVLSNMVVSIEQHVDWIADCLIAARAEGHRTVEATDDAQEQWMQQVAMVANLTVWPTGNSWYTGANIEGKVRSFPIFLGGVGPYRQICDYVAAQGYEGFTRSAFTFVRPARVPGRGT
ncbi:MAG TPA: NAD(P)/FAD-dependent oxidoreductase [Acidimicrobiia bacterium]|nr:NAD(P)/FAD-dependent oxidoreductase [Acidimicrobiia bacterium]